MVSPRAGAGLERLDIGWGFGKVVGMAVSIDHALSLRKSGDLQGAIAELEYLRRQYEDLPPVLFTLGATYFQARRFEDAVVCFQRAVWLWPAHEVSSLGLFHSLHELGRQHEAHREMMRFLVLGQSKNYRSILQPPEEKETE